MPLSVLAFRFRAVHCVYVCDHTLHVCEDSIGKTTRGNFTGFTTYVPFETKMN